MNYLIKGGRVICPKSGVDQIADVLIKDGLIASIAANMGVSEDVSIIEADGKLVMPGIVDIHTHLRTPGFEFKEDLKTGTESALAGGITTAVCMPNTNPVLDNPEMLLQLKEKIEKEALVHVEIISAITKGLKGETLADLEANAAAGAVGFSDDGRTTMNDDYMVEAFKIANKLGVPVLTHCEDHEKSELYKDRPAPPELEYVIVKRDIELCESVGGRLHICHISTKEGVEYVRVAKARGVRLTCEAAPHHFSISEEEIDSRDPYTKVNPPIRPQVHREALIQAIKEGVVDVIATDHAPHDTASKEKTYAEAAFGITGFETSFALTYTHLVKAGHISLGKMVEMMATRPAELLKLKAGTLEIGAVADVIIADLDATYTIDPSTFYSKGKNTPFAGKKVSGKVTHTFVKGDLKYKEGALCQSIN
ncbi:MAG: dihydroorotase [Clostridia bacterium]|nr:dihydroorotase [Clostridia bacterium]